MKNRFTTIDLRAAVSEIGHRLLGLRVINVYDINSKTYLIRLGGTDTKEMILFESGNRIHFTTFDWPKNQMPSNFNMKLRKHIRGRRLEQVKQLGIDRIVDLQFGSGEAAYHVIVELYDRGNVALTDHEYSIMILLRTRKDNDDVRFAVREVYPIDSVQKPVGIPNSERLEEIFKDAKPGDNLRRFLNPNFVFGPALIDHCLLCHDFPANARFDHDFKIDKDIPRLIAALEDAQKYLDSSGQEVCKGYIIQKREKKPKSAEKEEGDELLTFSEFHPFLFKQHESLPHKEFETFTEALDEFFSSVESQKLDMKALHQEREAVKKLDNVKKDQQRRLDTLQKTQELDKKKGQLVEMNLSLVDKAIRVVRSAIANQIDWKEIENIIKDAQKQGDPVAKTIKTLKLDINHITMLLQDPYQATSNDSEDENEDAGDHIKPMKIDIDLGLSAYANARKFYVQKKYAQVKERKTIDAAEKAIKSAEKKTKQALKDVAIVTSINKTRKTAWFEKFYWFISSENYVVIGGRDQQQNEMIYKRYLRPGDIYVHADLHGASSVVIKNQGGGEVPPKTLNEAGVMAICYSVAWDAKVVTSAWWVHHDQVSKTAPTGEFLTTGSFMIRGKKNFLPPVQLAMGFGFLFKLEESCIAKHKGERKIWSAEEDALSVINSSVADTEEFMEIPDEDEDEKEEDEKEEDEKEEDEKEEDEGENGVPQEVEQEDEQGSEKAVDTESSDEDEGMYPDTAIQLHHVTDTVYETQHSRGSSMLSSGSHGSADSEDVSVINLGDDKPFKIGQMEGKKTKHLTAKQKRDLKKKRKQGFEDSKDDENDMLDLTIGAEDEAEREEVEQEGEEKNEKHAGMSHKSEVEEVSAQPTQPKRGQKYKMKKMKQKYKDQDDEERDLRMQLLASAGQPKETKKKKGMKAKKLQEQSQSHDQSRNQQQKQNKQRGSSNHSKVEDVLVEGTETDALDCDLQQLKIDTTQEGKEEQNPEQCVKPVEFKHNWVDKKSTAQDGEASDDESTQTDLLQGETSVVDSLTGIPFPDDLLLFSLPVCAPYSAVQNYKYKVKVTPGSGKKGKAAKAALNMFQISKECTQREKDLFKSCKDVDLSRNLPGKVKISGPNIQRAKKGQKKK